MSNLTRRTYWEEESEAFVTECEEYMNVIGSGDTIEEAEKEFEGNLKAFLKSVKKGNALIIKNKGGRPQKENIPLFCNIKKHSKTYIDDLANKINSKQGATIDYLVAFHQKHSNCEML